MNSLSGGSKLSYRGIRHPASFHSPLNSATPSLATNATRCIGVRVSRSCTYGTSLNISLPASTCVCQPRTFPCCDCPLKLPALKISSWLRGTVAKNCDLTSKENRSFHTKLLLLMLEREKRGVLVNKSRIFLIVSFALPECTMWNQASKMVS